MRIWSIHPEYLDAKGLVALWREGLLAQNVLLGKTKGYKNHPQLRRFSNTDDPPGVLASYLRGVADEALRRGYNFDRSKIIDQGNADKIPVTRGQLGYEFRHLLKKLQVRDPALYERLKLVKRIAPHPLFQEVPGPVEEWEVIKPGRQARPPKP